jgi:hypothetical protein
MSLHIQRYNIEDFNRIMRDGFDYELDVNIRETIQTLSDKVGAPEYIRTPQFPKTNNSITNISRGQGMLRRNKYGQGETTEDDWNNIKNFQTTKLVKKEGLEKTIDTIRKYLNKISEKNFTNQRDNIFNELKEILNGDDNSIINEDVNNEFDKVASAIFSIASGNMFYSTLYARLYKEMMDEFPMMINMFKEKLVKFRDIFQTIEYCDSVKDYDKFCAINKENEKRRAISLFYVNLMKLDIITSEEIMSIIKDLQEYQMSKIVEEGNKHIVDELSEVISIMLMNVISEFTKKNITIDTNNWETIVTCIENVASMKASDHPSITSKSIFKHMDIMDEINKQ